MQDLISLFDYTGSWASAWAENGLDYNVICWDIKHGNDVHCFDSMASTLEILDNLGGILAAPPCTDFTKSGAQYWPAKDANGSTQMSLAMVDRVLALVDAMTPTDPDWYEYAEEAGVSWFWVLENPVGRLQKLRPQLGAPFYFEPWEYAGHLELSDSDHNELERIRRKDARGVSFDEAMFVMDCNAYTKKTGLWGEFNRNLEKAPIEPVRVCKQGSPLMMLGGKSEQTKAIRSITPQGFGKAFYKANRHYIARPEFI